MNEISWLRDIKWVFFDLDNTLIDFEETSRHAIRKLLPSLDQDEFDCVYQDFKRINTEVWHAFERNEMTGIEVRSVRFERLFEIHDVSEHNGKEFGKLYLDKIVELSYVYPGVKSLLSHLKTTFGLSIITNGFKEVQRPRLNRLDLTGCFDSIIVSDEIDVSKPDLAFFEYAHADIGEHVAPAEILVVGDSLNSDIKGGNNFGARTCWLSHGKEASSEDQPDISFRDITGLSKVLMKCM